jgi:hypothetical protein
VKIPFARLSKDRNGSSAVEFALLAPVFIALMMGVVEVGIYMQNFNAVRSLATESSRFAAVEYQKNNKMTVPTLETNIRSMAVQSPYNLSDDRLHVDIEEVTPSPIDGARQFNITLTYDLPDIVGGTSIDNISIDYSRQVFVLA